jgi:glycosyltransferase involved in cell wall biosynthesis
VNGILPELRAILPDASVTLVGKSPSASVLALHDPPSGVWVTGEVPDVRPYLAAADLFVVPVKTGGGTRLKVVEALAAGLPVVGTTLGLEGLDANDQELALTADTTAEFVDAIQRLFQDRELRSRLIRNGRRAAVESFSWSQVGRGFIESIEDRVHARK